MMRKLTVETTENGILLATIQRPTVRNAIDFEVMDELERVLDEVNGDHLCKAFVITGSGEQAFCSGGDLATFMR